MLKVVIFFSLFLLAVSHSIYFDEDLFEWGLFKLFNKKTFKDETEEAIRFEIFKDNRQYILQHNRKWENGEVSFRIGVNEYADLLNFEFNEMMNGNDQNGPR